MHNNYNAIWKMLFTTDFSKSCLCLPNTAAAWHITLNMNPVAVFQKGWLYLMAYQVRDGNNKVNYRQHVLRYCDKNAVESRRQENDLESWFNFKFMLIVLSLAKKNTWWEMFNKTPVLKYNNSFFGHLIFLCCRLKLWGLWHLFKL